MQKKLELKVHIAEDDETGRWYISESEVPGLRLEADTALELIRRIELAAPEMIEANLDEVIAAHGGGSEFGLALTPIFDSPLALAPA